MWPWRRIFGSAECVCVCVFKSLCVCVLCRVCMLRMYGRRDGLKCISVWPITIFENRLKRVWLDINIQNNKKRNYLIALCVIPNRIEHTTNEATEICNHRNACRIASDLSIIIIIIALFLYNCIQLVEVISFWASRSCMARRGYFVSPFRSPPCPSIH